ncbi:MAG TPA: O-antigen ligase family protein [Gaiellaceae bacterium]|nr:O-antigen ligase family protein [Gaiellaceae bacterium]
MIETRRTALDLVVAGTLWAAVLAAACGSSVLLGFVSVGKPARWWLLGLLGVVALARALAFRSEWRLRPFVVAGLVLLCALCLESSAWSILPRTTFERSVSVCVVISVSAILAGSAALSTATADRLLGALLAAAAAVAAAGFILWLVDPSTAVQAASTEYPARFEGFEQNPNTAAMLLAFGMPLAFGRALAARTVRRALPFVLLLLAFIAEIVASGSRGGLAAGFLALLVVPALAAGPRRRRIGVAAAVLAALVVAAWAMTIPRALTAATPPVPSAPSAAGASRGIDAETVIPLREEIGGPWWTHTSGAIHRTLFSTSTRTRAWRGAIDQALGRPVEGFGFGAEQPAFVNRYYGFHSDNPENGYIGLFIQVGLAGLLGFLAVAVLCLAPAVRQSLRGEASRDGWAPAAVGGASAGLFLGMSQSYFHAAGNIVFLAFWVALLLASVAGISPRPKALTPPG